MAGWQVNILHELCVLLWIPSIWIGDNLCYVEILGCGVLVYLWRDGKYCVYGKPSSLHLGYDAKGHF